MCVCVTLPPVRSVPASHLLQSHGGEGRVRDDFQQRG